MITETIEIRGIPRSRLVIYLQEIKEKLDSELITDHWEGYLSNEEFFFLFQSEIPKVTVTFTATDPLLLTRVLKDFRLKTLRAGA